MTLILPPKDISARRATQRKTRFYRTTMTRKVVRACINENRNESDTQPSKGIKQEQKTEHTKKNK